MAGSWPRTGPSSPPSPLWTERWIGRHEPPEFSPGPTLVRLGTMPGAAFLYGDDVTLRTVEEEDIDFLQEQVNDPGIWRAIGRSRPVNRTQEEDFYEAIVSDGDTVQLLITVDGEAVGMISLESITQEQGHAEIGFWMAPDHREQGYATEATALLVSYAFDQLRLHKVIGRVFAFNDASRRLFEGLGFTQEGVHREEQYIDGSYHDVYWYGVLESEWNPNQQH